MSQIIESYEADKLTILDCSKLRFEKEESGYMTLYMDGKTYNKVNLTRLQPFYQQELYISVHIEDEERQFREIGVIEDIKKLPKEQYELVSDFLRYKYYMPEITRIYSIKENMRGSLFVKAETTAGGKTICIRDWYTNFKLIGGKYLYVCDADGNKYFCDNVEEKLDRKSIAAMEMFT